MLDPRFAFSAAGTLVILCWLALAASLFVPALRPGVWRVAGMIVPGLIAIAYIILLHQGWGTVPGGGFGSIAAVRALFADDSALAAGWLHYLAFDLFVGTSIARVGSGRGIPPALLLPCLPLTFLVGPAGLLLFLIIEGVSLRVTKGAAA